MGLLWARLAYPLILPSHRLSGLPLTHLLQLSPAMLHSPLIPLLRLLPTLRLLSHIPLEGNVV
jgi:hypothetical protein